MAAPADQLAALTKFNVFEAFAAPLLQRAGSTGGPRGPRKSYWEEAKEQGLKTHRPSSPRAAKP